MGPNDVSSPTTPSSNKYSNRIKCSKLILYGSAKHGKMMYEMFQLLIDELHEKSR